MSCVGQYHVKRHNCKGLGMQVINYRCFHLNCSSMNRLPTLTSYLYMILSIWYKSSVIYINMTRNKALELIEKFILNLEQRTT